MFQKTANGTPKPSGMSMMITSLLGSIGLTPETIAAHIEQGKMLATQFVAAMSGMNQRMAILEERYQELNKLVREIHNATVHTSESELVRMQENQESVRCRMPNQS